MCWTLGIALACGTAALVLAACIGSFWDHHNARCGATVVAYFALMIMMEFKFVQAAQHFVLATDANPTNQRQHTPPANHILTHLADVFRSPMVWR